MKNSPGFLTFAVLTLLAIPANGQDRLKAMPGYEQYQKMSREIPGSVKLGVLRVTWKDGGKTFEYRKDGKAYRYDIATGKSIEAPAAGPEEAPPEGRGFGRGRQGGVARGRQSGSALSPDGKLRAVYKDRNLWLADAAGGNEAAITTDGSEKARVKYGAASWV